MYSLLGAVVSLGIGSPQFLAQSTDRASALRDPLTNDRDTTTPASRRAIDAGKEKTMSDQNSQANDRNLVFMRIRTLERKAGYRLRRQGCVKPEQCGHDVAQDLAFGKNCEVVEDEIRLNYPDAHIPEAMLHKDLEFA